MNEKKTLLIAGKVVYTEYTSSSMHNFSVFQWVLQLTTGFVFSFRLPFPFPFPFPFPLEGGVGGVGGVGGGGVGDPVYNDMAIYTPSSFALHVLYSDVPVVGSAPASSERKGRKRSKKTTSGTFTVSEGTFT